MLKKVTFTILCTTISLQLFSMNFDMELSREYQQKANLAESIRLATYKSEPSERTRSLSFAAGALTAVLWNAGLHFALPKKKTFSTQMTAFIAWFLGSYVAGRGLYKSLVRTYLNGQASSYLIRISSSEKPFAEMEKFNTAVLQNKKLEAAFEAFIVSHENSPFMRNEHSWEFLQQQLKSLSLKNHDQRIYTSFFFGMFFPQLFFGFLPLRWLQD